LYKISLAESKLLQRFNLAVANSESLKQEHCEKGKGLFEFTTILMIQHKMREWILQLQENLIPIKPAKEQST
jgi:hypothetical protein